MRIITVGLCLVLAAPALAQPINQLYSNGGNTIDLSAPTASDAMDAMPMAPGAAPPAVAPTATYVPPAAVTTIVNPAIPLRPADAQVKPVGTPVPPGQPIGYDAKMKRDPNGKLILDDANAASVPPKPLQRNDQNLRNDADMLRH